MSLFAAKIAMKVVCTLPKYFVLDTEQLLKNSSTDYC